MKPAERYGMSWKKDADGSIWTHGIPDPKGNWVHACEYDRLWLEVQRLTIALRTADRVLAPMREAAEGHPLMREAVASALIAIKEEKNK